ncbi:hypothetical protein HHK36_026597 [Tetracentron sinense]|uniref:Helicase ATP-binding domain-containing protein n=1 Tax=Tetracentron sinense TaxID=13715 RepID=A0A834YH42_TETSI|nr:hypothetical protein HHK36_026597 [Tetracentron sinense]
MPAKDVNMLVKHVSPGQNYTSNSGSMIPDSCIDSHVGENCGPNGQKVSEIQKQCASDGCKIVPLDKTLKHGNPVTIREETIEQEEENKSVSTDLPPPPKYTLEKWIMDQQKRKHLEEQNWVIKLRKAEQRIAVCFDKSKQTVSSSEDISAKTKIVIELKKLQLLQLQRRLRRTTSTYRDLIQVQHLPFRDRLEDWFKIKTERWKGFNKYIKEFLKRKDQTHFEKIDRIQCEKIKLLKNNDVEGCLGMVQDAKSDRVKQLLKETEKYLQKLRSKMRDAKTMAKHFEMGMDENRAANSVEKIEVAIENEYENDQAETSLVIRNSVEFFFPALNPMLKFSSAVIALICYLMEPKNDRGPFLVVVPSSVLPGWVSEISSWVPGINKIAYAGPPEERRRERIVHQKFNVLLTTYEYLMNKHDRPKLSKIHWHYIIIDEGHRIKNASCQLNADLKLYQSSHRLLLTGTPLQGYLKTEPRVKPTSYDHMKSKSGPSHAIDITREAIREEVDTVIAVGGDNTLHEVKNDATQLRIHLLLNIFGSVASYYGDIGILASFKVFEDIDEQLRRHDSMELIYNKTLANWCSFNGDHNNSLGRV